ncbi:MAG: 3-oxoadipate enol-lactonase [Geminicoccaceae bacterium]|nr:MAG: 3-oxoadipate enol-lactonase [Geminicoccaceae bacterium]
MPFADAGGIRLHYELTGPDDAPVVLFANSLGADLSMWDRQAAALAGRFRVLRYDMRGHGRSEVPPGPYRLDGLARDAVALLDALGIDRVHFCGLSLGGAVGQWLGIHRPERLRSLVLCATACSFGAASTWDERIAAVQRGGVEAIADAVLERWLGADFRARRPSEAARLRAMLCATPAEGYAAAAAAVRDTDLCAEVHRIAVPTLLIAGSADPATPPARLEELRARIPRAELVVLEGAHIVNVEAADAFDHALLAFLDEQERSASGLPRELYARGLEIRRAVLGDAWVDRALARTTELDRAFQEMLTTWCWGAVWGRPGLPRRTRSLLNLAMLAALGHHEELKLHIRGALRNGVSEAEIGEVFLQVAVYAGVPAANSAFRIAKETLREIAAEGSAPEREGSR